MSRDRDSGRGARARAGGPVPRGGPSARAGAAAAGPLSPALDPRHPAFLIALAVAAACIVIDVSFRLYDTDMWQHLLVGRAIWQLHRVPTQQLWTWPTYGAPDVNSSWGFRALIWPIWNAFGVAGLFAWRWVSALAVFGLVWRAARRMGAAGFAPLVAIAWCAVTYRQRSQIRPETLVSVLLAAQLWILESWRARERLSASAGAAAVPARQLPGDHRLWLIVIALIWANAHISYWMGLAIQFIYAIGAWPSPRTPVAPTFERLGLRGWRAPAATLAASGAISFVNPWGWRALWQPFEYYLLWRHEPIFKSIGELSPVTWSYHWSNLLIPLLVATVALLVWRSWRRSVDRVEWLMLGIFVPLALSTQRFLGFLMVMIALFLARDLDEFVRSRRGSPAAGASPPDRSTRWIHGAAAALLCVAISLPEWARTSMPLGVGIDWRTVPVRACDAYAAGDVRGRMFNQFAEGGYIAYRFWPDRARLPFMDIHQAGSREDRFYYAYSMQDSAAWRVLDDKYRFDAVMLFTFQNPNDHLIDRLDADTTRWALVFSDDAGALFLRREGANAALAERLRYRCLPAGKAAWYPRLAAAIADSGARRLLEADFRRAAEGSPWNARALTGLALLADATGRESEAFSLLDRAIAGNPLAANAHRYRAELRLGLGDARGAIADLERERTLGGSGVDLELDSGRAYQQAGDRTRALASYRRALRLEPQNVAARDSLARLSAGPGR